MEDEERSVLTVYNFSFSNYPPRYEEISLAYPEYPRQIFGKGKNSRQGNFEMMA